MSTCSAPPLVARWGKGLIFCGNLVAQNFARGKANSPDWTIREGRLTMSARMSALFFKRFLQRPLQVASIIPSSKALVERVADKVDFARARVIAEYGPGEGAHSREIARRMRPDTQLLLFELDPAFSRDLERQFTNDARIHVLNQDAAALPQELRRRGIAQCDYILSGSPVSIRNSAKKRCKKRRSCPIIPVLPLCQMRGRGPSRP